MSEESSESPNPGWRVGYVPGPRSYEAGFRQGESKRGPVPHCNSYAITSKFSVEDSKLRSTAQETGAGYPSA